MNKEYKYDIAFSFAEEDFSIAEQIAEALREKGLSYYLYTEHVSEHLGKAIMKITQQVYGIDTRHVLMLTSEIFVKKYWTSIESQIILIEASNKPDFIFRVKLDETPVDGIAETITSLKWRDNPAEIAKTICEKIEFEKMESKTAYEKNSSAPLKLAAAMVGLSNRSTIKSGRRKWLLVITSILLGILLIASRFICTKPKDVAMPSKVYVPAGAFIMGNDSSWKIWKPVHKVSLPAFYISKTEVTVAQYRSYCNATGNAMPPAPPYHCGEQCPVVNVTWEEAAAYCKWAGGRLPTEAEWEYAAGKNGQVGDKYSGANAIDKVGYYAGNTKQAHQVGQKKPNALGLLDMSGNAAEWCNDWLGPYDGGEQNSPKGALDGTYKVLRGGHYQSRISSDTSANELLIAYRDKDYPAARKPYIGFRVVWNAN